MLQWKIYVSLLVNMQNIGKEKKTNRLYISLLNVWKKIPESVYQQDVDHRQDEEQSQL